MKRFLFVFFILFFSFNAFAHMNWEKCKEEVKNSNIQSQGAWQKCLDKIAKDDNARELLGDHFFHPVRGIMMSPETLDKKEYTVTNEDASDYKMEHSLFPDGQISKKDLIVLAIVDVMSKFCSDEFHDIMREGYTSPNNDDKIDKVRLAYWFKDTGADSTDFECVAFDLKKSQAVNYYPKLIGLMVSNRPHFNKGTVLNRNNEENVLHGTEDRFWHYKCSDHSIKGMDFSIGNIAHIGKGGIQDSVINDAARSVLGTNIKGHNVDYFIDFPVGDDDRIFPGLIITNHDPEFSITFESYHDHLEKDPKILTDFYNEMVNIGNSGRKWCYKQKTTDKPMRIYAVALNKNTSRDSISFWDTWFMTTERVILQGNFFQSGDRQEKVTVISSKDYVLK